MADEDSLRHKYTPLPEEPRYRKKAKKTHVRSDHKHVYEEVCVDSHSYVYRRDEGRVHVYETARRCKVCGRLADVRLTPLREPPEGMPLYEVPGWSYMFDHKTLPSELEVRPS